MATRSLTVCRHVGCGVLIPVAGFCDRHRKDQGWFRTSKGSSHERGYGARWRRLRQQILERDLFLCQVCRRNGHLSSASDVHHIVAKAEGGSDNPSNLESICRSCHKQETARACRGRGE